MNYPTYTWYLQSDTIQSSTYFDDAFTAQECDDIIAKFANDPLTKGTTETNNTSRNSDIAFLRSDVEDNQWIFRRCVDLVTGTNNKWWQFDINKIENIQFTVYNVGQYYELHQDLLRDSAAGNFRKISFTLQLSDPDSYQGGDLQIHNSGKPWTAPRQRGCMTFFPSYVLHEVTPITQGTRYSLVGWISGPKFR